MPTPTNPRISIELEAGADPIQGAIERADGRRQPFWGWLELIEELRRLAEGGTAEAGSSRTTRGSRKRP